MVHSNMMSVLSPVKIKLTECLFVPGCKYAEQHKSLRQEDVVAKWVKHGTFTRESRVWVLCEAKRQSRHFMFTLSYLLFSAKMPRHPSFGETQSVSTAFTSIKWETNKQSCHNVMPGAVGGHRVVTDWFHPAAASRFLCSLSQPHILLMAFFSC